MHVLVTGISQLMILVMMCSVVMWAEIVKVIDNRKIKSQIFSGKVWSTFVPLLHLTSLNGSHAGDQNSRFTFVSNKGNSVNDYCIFVVDLISKLNINFEVGARVESSHMPLQFNINSQTKYENKSIEKCEKKRKRNESETEPDHNHAENFLEAINSADSQCRIQEAFNLLESCVDLTLRQFTETLLQAAQCMKRTIWFDTGHSRDTDRCVDGDASETKEQKSVKHVVC